MARIEIIIGVSGQLGEGGGVYVLADANVNGNVDAVLLPSSEE